MKHVPEASQSGRVLGVRNVAGGKAHHNQPLQIVIGYLRRTHAVGDAVTPIPLLPSQSNKRGYTGAKLTGYHDEPFLLHQPIHLMGNSSAMAMGAENKPRIWGQEEWRSGEFVKSFVQGLCSEKLRDADGNQVLTET